jgi:hypothetical protein
VDVSNRLAETAVERLEAAATAAERAAGSYGPVGAVLGDLLGLDSTSSAFRAREEARKTRELAGIMRAKLATLSEAEVPAFIADASAYANVSDLLSQARRLSAAGFVEEVAAPTARELVETVRQAGEGWRRVVVALPYLAAGAGVLALVVGAVVLVRRAAP